MHRIEISGLNFRVELSAKPTSLKAGFVKKSLDQVEFQGVENQMFTIFHPVAKGFDLSQNDSKF